MKKLFILFAITIILIGVVSAFDFDNVKSYDEGQKVITIKNAFGLPLIGDNLAEYSLDYNTDQCLINCEARGTATLYTDGYLFTDMNFKDIKGQLKEINYKIYIKANNSYQIDVNDYGKEVCSLSINGTQTCSTPIVGTHKEYVERWIWQEYKGEVLSEGTYRWKIEGKKNIGESIDWIGESFGEEFTEWAWWDNNWNYKKTITVTDTAGSEINNYTIDMIFDKESNMDDELEDIRFINSAEDTEYGYWIYYSNSTSFKVKVRIEDSLNPSSDLIMYMYYGNSGASTTSDIDDAHLIGEDGADFSEWTEVDGGSHINLDTTKRIINFTNVCRDSDTGVVKQALDSSIINLTIEYQIEVDNIFGGSVFHVGIADQDVDKASSITGSGIMAMPIESGGEKVYLRTELDNSVVVEFKTDSATTRYWIKTTRYGTQTNSTYYSDSKKETIDNTLNVTYGSSTEPFDRAYMFASDGDNGNPSACADGWLTNYSISRYVYPEPTYSVGAELGQAELETSVTLTSPDDDSEFNSYTQYFSANFSVTAGNMTNATLYIWDSTGAEYGTNVTLNLNGTSNSTNVSLLLEAGNNQEWNFYGCAVNSTNDVDCAWASSNRTFDIIPFIVNSRTFSNIVYETSNQSYEIEIEADEVITSVSAKLWYNGTSYTSSVTDGGSGIYTAKNTIDVPTTNINNNKTFWWEFNFVLTSGSTLLQNTSESTQEVNKTYLSICNATYNVNFINFTTKNAENPFPDLNATFKSAWDWYIKGATGTQKQVYSFENITENASSFNFCMSPANMTFKVDSHVEVDATGYSINTHYLEDAEINNASTAINVYLLNDSDATLTTLQVQDYAQNAKPNVTIQVQLYDVGTDTYYTTAMAKTNIDGEDIVYLNWYDSLYRFILIEDGVTIEITTPYRVAETPQIFDIGAETTYVYDKFRDFDYSLYYSNATSSFVLIFTKPSGLVDKGCLRVIKRTTSADTDICHVCESSSSATLYCSVSGQGNGTYIATFYATGSLFRVASITTNLGSTFSSEIYDLLGNDDATAYAFILSGVVVALFIFSPVMAIIGMLLALAASAYLGFVMIDYMVFSGIILVGGIIIWLLKR